MAVLSEESDQRNNHKSVWQFLIVNLFVLFQKRDQQNGDEAAQRFIVVKEIDHSQKQANYSLLEKGIHWMLDSLEKGVGVFVDKRVIPVLKRIRERLRKRR